MADALSGVEAGHPERIVPDETDSGVVALHLKRYVFAERWAAGSRVLDAACGVGYGSHRLAQVAREVVGVDANDAALAYARSRYPHANLAFQHADVTQLPFDDSSFDLVCSFETIEHVDHPEAALDEFARVLTENGLLVISTPWADETTRAPANPHHRIELSREDFAAALATRFAMVEIYGQRRKQTRRHRLAQRLDVFGLRRRLPAPSLAVKALGTATTATLTLDDIEISAGALPGASELIGVCRLPRRI
jgi:2-polyprenyl-3-methyl-5-hydroxy-6-metoxy-1,4-benzoquinol methylase